jgi:phospholipid/cholesterol/gamma-HCH transport system substrate-binding protein
MTGSKKHLTWAKLRVGIVISLALLVVFFAVMFAGHIEKLFKPRVPVYVIFNDVKGLKAGAPVWFSGIEIGYVESLSLVPGDKVRAAISIDSGSLKFLKEDSHVTIQTLGLFGDKYVELLPGSRDAELLKPGGEIRGETAQVVENLVKTTGESVKSAKEFINMMEKVLEKIDKGEGAVPMLLRDPEISRNLRKTAKSLENFSHNLETSRGTLSRMIEDDTLYSNLNTAATNLNGVAAKLDHLLENIEGGKGALGTLVKDEELTVELKSTIRDLDLLIEDIRGNPKKYFKFSIF